MSDSLQPLTVCLVSQQYPPVTARGGIGTQTYLKARALAALGHSVHVLSSSGTHAFSVTQEESVVVHRIPHPGMDTTFSEPSVHWIGYSWAVARQLAILERELPLDLIEFPEYGAEGFIHQLNAHQMPHVPTVVMLHGSLAMFAERVGWPPHDSEFCQVGTFMEDAVVARADLLLAASQNIARFWADRTNLPLHRISVVHTTVDAEFFTPGASPSNTRPTVLFVGRVDAAKGALATAEAVLRLRRRFPTILFRVIGSADESTLACLRELITRHDAAASFELLGAVPHPELPAQYRACDVFASPAPQEHGVASVYLEAASCGKPVVACHTGGAPEAVINGETGFLVPPGDVATLTEALERLLGDRELRETMGWNGRRRVLHHFALDRHIGRVLPLYEQLVRRSNARGHAAR